MKPEFLFPLPASIQSKVEDVERAIGSEIAVCRGATVEHQDRNSEPPRAVCVCDDRSGTLKVKIVLTAEAVTHNLVHEVLHAHRAAVLRTPRLLLRDGSSNSLTSGLNNDAEHLFIVPEEIRLDGAAQAFWEAEESRHFRALKERLASTPDEGDLRAVRHGLLRQWVFVTRALDRWPREQELADLLERSGWATDAHRLRAQIEGAGSDAPGIVSAYLRAAHLDLDRYAFFPWRVGHGTAGNAEPPVPGRHRDCRRTK